MRHAEREERGERERQSQIGFEKREKEEEGRLTHSSQSESVLSLDLTEDVGVEEMIGDFAGVIGVVVLREKAAVLLEQSWRSVRAREERREQRGF